MILTDPAVQGVVGFAGATGGNAAENTARLFIQLKPLSERNVSAQEVIQRLRPKVAQVIGANFFMQAGQDVNVGGRLTKTEYQYTLTDSDTAELNHWAPILQREMEKLPELQDVASDQQIASPHIAIDIDRDAAYRLGLTLSQIDQTLYDAFGQRQVATIYTSSHQYKVILEVEPQFQNDPQALGGIYLATPTGARVPLSTIAKFTTKVEPLTVNHQGQFPSVTLSFNVAPGHSLGQAVSAIQTDRARSACSDHAAGHVPGHGAGVPAIAVIDAASGRGRDPGCLHRARLPVRELHPPDHDPVGLAVGRRRRADHAHAARI